MRGLRAITAGIFLFSILFGGDGSVLASEPNVRVNEVLPDPEGRDNDTEFIEIKNPKERDLTGWTIYIQTKDESQKDAEQIVLNDSIDTKTTFIVLDEEIGYLNNERVEVYIHDSTDAQVGPVLEYPVGDREDPKEATSYGFTEQSEGVIALDSISKGKPNTQESKEDKSNTEQQENDSEETQNSESDQTQSSDNNTNQEQSTEDNTGEKTHQNDTSEQGQQSDPNNEQSSSSEEKKESSEKTSLTKTENQSSPENQDNQNKNKDQSDKSKDPQSESEESSSSTDSVQNENTTSSGGMPHDTENQSSDSSNTKTQSNIEQEARSKDESKEEKSYNGSSNLRIQSLLPNPEQTDAEHEQLTLTNYGEKSINITDWAIFRRNGESRNTTQIQLPEMSIKAGTSKQLSASDIPTLINTPDQIVMYSVLNPDGNIVDNVYYTQAPEGERYVYQKESEKMKWISSQSKSKDQESVQSSEKTSQKPSNSSEQPSQQKHVSKEDIFLHEVFPDPQNQSNEFIELKVKVDSEYSLKDWKLSDGTTTAKIAQSPLTTTYPTFTRKETGIALNNHQPETITLYAPNGDQVDSIEVTNQKEQQAYAHTGNTWKWTKSQTPNKANTITKNSQPREKAESKETESGNNSNEPSEKRHASKEGEERSNSDTSSSKESSEQRTSSNTDISVSLNEIFPYPEGKQTKEFIELHVQDHDSYSLKGWVLTDGTRSVELEDTTRNTSYPVFQRSETQIALNNHSSETIQLLNTHGEVVDSVQITNQKADASYAFHQDEWQWTGTPTKQTSNTITDISSNQETTDEQSDSQKEKSQSYQSVDEISEIFKKEHERNVQVTGTVYLVPGSVSDRFFVLSDEKRALKVYNFSQKFPKMKEGDMVTVKGEVYTKHEETRLVTNKQQVTVTDTSSQLDIPKEVSANRQSITPSNQGQEVRLTGELLEQSGDSFYMRTSTNRELRIAILPNVKMKKPNMRAGDTVSVSGLIDVYRDDVRILTWRESYIVPHNSQEEKSDTENTDTQDEDSKEPAPTSNSSSSRSSYELDQLLKDARVQEGHIYSDSVAARMSSYLPPALKNQLQRYPFLVGVMSMVGLWICGEILRYIVRKRLT